MLIRSQINTLRLHWVRSSLFASLPSEVMVQIIHSPTSDEYFLDALQDTAFGRKQDLLQKLEQAKANKEKLKLLLLQAGDVVTPGGVLVKNTTILGCLICGGDLELAQAIIPYYFEFEQGKAELSSQLEYYRPCIETLTTLKHDYDVTWLIEIIKKSSLQDVAAELATGDQYDPTYQSLLRESMSKFRSDMLDPKRRIVKGPRLHCNYQNLIHVDDFLNRKWEDLIEGNNYDKHRLVSRQIYGLLELLALPAYERYVFARGQTDAAIAGKEIERSFAFKNPSKFGAVFPAFSSDLVRAHSGVAFDSWITIYGRGVDGWLAGARDVFTKLMLSKSNKWQQLYAAAVPSLSLRR